MKNEKHISVVRLTSLALLAALIVVLQTVASGIKIGPVPISLTLVPIVVGAILFGPGAGAFLGGVFGVVCLIAGIAGTDQFTNLLWVLPDRHLCRQGGPLRLGRGAGVPGAGKAADARLHCRGNLRADCQHRRFCHRHAHGF